MLETATSLRAGRAVSVCCWILELQRGREGGRGGGGGDEEGVEEEEREGDGGGAVEQQMLYRYR